MEHKSPGSIQPAIAIVLVLILLGGGYVGFSAYRAQINGYDATVADLQSQLAAASSTNQALSDALVSSQAQATDLALRINELNGTVNNLSKLADTDPQLLAKYSKVYFLNENYVPFSLSKIPSQYTYDDTKDYQFLTDAITYLEHMIQDGNRDHADLQVLSAYRSFSDQAAIKSGYKVIYGSGANAFSADQGYSEHQLGTAIDLTTTSLKGGLDGFDKTAAYAWMSKNAYQYGFILSYPAGNAYYEYEPWHWRFVGLTLATYLHNQKENFYDMDQRDINDYLINFPN